MPGYLDDLIALVPPPPERVQPRYDWDKARAALGSEIPPDFIDLIHAYGSGLFDEFLWILEPDCPNPNLNFVNHVNECQEAFEYLINAGHTDVVPESVLHGEDRLIAWTCDEYGNVAYWRASPTVRPSEWRVMVGGDRGAGPGWYEVAMTATEFLYRVLSGSLRPEVYEGALPQPFHSFKPTGPAPADGEG